MGVQCYGGGYEIKEVRMAIPVLIPLKQIISEIGRKKKNIRMGFCQNLVIIVCRIILLCVGTVIPQS